MQLKRILEYVAAKVIIFILSLLPFSLVIRLGSVLGLFAYYVVPIRRSVALTNLRAAFPEKSGKERKKICRNTYRNFGMTFFEYFCLSRLSPENIRQIVTFDPPDCLQKAMAKNQGVIFVTGHFSSFELLGVAIANSGIPIDVVVKAMKNPYIERILDTFRNNTNLSVIKLKHGFSKVAKSVAQKRMIAMIADQDAGTKGAFVKFFGMESSVPAGPAILAVRSKAPMVSGFIVREGIAQYTANIYNIPYDNLPETKKDQIREITQRYSSLLESYVRKYPEQYFWMHKRWKTAGIYDRTARKT